MPESAPKQIRLAINLLASGRHNASWKTLDQPETLSTDIDHFIRIAKTAERGLLDGVFLADNYAGFPPEAYGRPWRAIAPGVLLSALAMHTSRIGLVLTAPALFGDPASLAREISSLDHVSKGRGAWNIITSQHEHQLAVLGADGELPRDAKYDKADEYVSIVTRLWESLPPSAITADAARHAYVDRTRLRPVDVQGDYYRSAGVLGITGGYNGQRPVIVQAGASDSSKQFGSKWADALFTSHWEKPSAQEFYRDVKAYAENKWHRDPGKLLVVPGVYPVLGSTETEAIQRKADLDDQLDLEQLKGKLAELLGVDTTDLDLARELPYGKIPAADPEKPEGHVRREKVVESARERGATARTVLLEYITGGHRVVVGTAEQVADDLTGWVDSDACDGFNFNIDRYPDGLEHLVDWLVPELQARGRFRTEYESATFRGNLGLGS
ncbi:MAG TPA: NtaA/DmoA family FMN-dependent monooxygenase [Trebonia sp.]|jgi:FMN-dependent oxidoreductase (nitrilotriacetate monooxygenase family)